MIKANLVFLWFYQLGFRLNLTFILCLLLTPIFTYMHFNIPDHNEAITFTHYSFGLIYRGGIFLIFLFVADACRFIFQENN